MNTTNQQERVYQERLYKVCDIAAFRKTAEIFGGLSNMAPGYPIKVNGIAILTTEALYQACRFPHMPEVQARILKERSPMTAKMVGKPFRSQSRIDFEKVKIDIMRWCLRIKLAQNFSSFGRLIESTGNLAIVEDSHKDAFWGAMRDKTEPDTLKGVNALGRLLMELRHQYIENRYSSKIFKIEPLQIPDFKLLGHEIEVIDERSNFLNFITNQLCINEENKNPLPKSYYPSQISKGDKFSLQIEEPKPDLVKTVKQAVKKPTSKKGINKKPDLQEKPKKRTPKAKEVKPLPLFRAC